MNPIDCKLKEKTMTLKPKVCTVEMSCASLVFERSTVPTMIATYVKYYVTCPCCGRRLCKAVPGSEIETECPKCNMNIQITVAEDKSVTTKVLEIFNNQ